MLNGCQRGHESHPAHEVTVRLGGPTGFGDYAPIPERYAREWRMFAFDRFGDEADPRYCPALDAVSEMLTVHGVWEPQETILALHVLTAAPGLVVDFGCHVGWYSLLAASCGCEVLAIDAMSEPLQLLDISAGVNGWEQLILAMQETIGPSTPPMIPTRIRFAKIDLDGDDEHAVNVLGPSITAGLVDHMLIEISPTLGPGYPELVTRIIGAGFRCYRMPDKQYPPVSLDNPRDIVPYRIDDWPARRRDEWIESVGQCNLWFRHEGAR